MLNTINEIRPDSYQEQGEACRTMLHDCMERRQVHAYLLSGISGVGKKTLALLSAQSLFCQEKNKPCQTCSSCRRVLNLTHPDLAWVRPGYDLGSDQMRDTARNLINVETIRSVLELVSQQTMESQDRVIILEQADRMNIPAQNALLRTLEDPPDHVCFFLLTDKPAVLLPTIRSRCRMVSLHPWSDSFVETVLRQRESGMTHIRQAVHLSGGSIGLALQIASDEQYWIRQKEILQAFLGFSSSDGIWATSEQWKERRDDAELIFSVLENQFRSWILARYTDTEILSEDLPEAFDRIAREGTLKNYLSLLDALENARSLLASQVNWQSVMEKMLLAFAEVKQAWST